MIGLLQGTLIENTGDYCLIQTGGVGYLVYISAETASDLIPHESQVVTLYIHTIVREDALDLYGFSTIEEKRFFQQVISISGIGPKSGLGIVSVAPLPQLKSAIANGDTSYLTQVSGIGKKSAQKIVLELQDKLSNEIIESGGSDNEHTEDHQVIEALLSLGYSNVQARSALKNLDSEISGMSNRLTACLRQLGK